MTANQAGRGRFKKLLLLFALLALALQLLYFPLPKMLLRPIASYTASWLLNEPQEPPSLPEEVARKYTGELLQQSLIAHFHAVGPQYRNRDDARFAGEQLLRLRKTMINQRELYHAALTGPALLTGLGWCDMINGVAGRLLAHDFDRVGIVGVRDPATGGGHSFGRFWSNQYDDWLYFDIWAETVMVFRKVKGQAPIYLFDENAGPGELRWPDDVALIRQYHARVDHGFLHNELQASTGGYFAHRIVNYLRHSSTSPAEVSGTLNTLAANSNTPSKRIAPRASSRATHLYASARIAHLLGDKKAAENLYRIVAKSDGGKSVFGQAAMILEKRLVRER